MKVHILTKGEMAMQKLNLLLLEIASIPAPYPPALLAARRAAVVAEIRRKNDRTCEHCGDPARSYVPIYTGPEGLAIDRLAGPTIDLCDSHVRRWSDLYRFEPVRSIDPDAVDIPTPPVSEHQDERNSRPEPF